MQRIGPALRVWRVGASAACLVLAATVAEAASCTVSTTSVNFGSYNVYATAPNDSTGTVTLSCNGGAKNVLVEINQGDGPSVSNRAMNRGVELLYYNLYQNAARTITWGDGAGAPAYNVGDPPNNTDIRLTIHARIPAGQDISAGSYTDNVTVTVQY